MASGPMSRYDFRSLSNADLLSLLTSHAKYKQRSSETHDRDHLPVLSSPQPISLLFLGDSMFERFRWSYVDTSFSQNRKSFPDFFNAGVGGDKICNVIYRLTSKGLLENLKSCGVKTVFLEMGTNDLRNDNHPLQAVHLDQYALVIEALRRASPDIKICVCGLNPRKRAKMGIVEKSNQLLESLVKEMNGLQEASDDRYSKLEYMPPDDKLNDFDTYLEDDGVHLNKQGYDIFATTLQAKVESLSVVSGDGLGQRDTT